MKKRMLADGRRQRGGRWLRDERGAAAVEFALVLPVVLMMLFGIIEFGRAWNVRQTLTDAAREGARVAAVGNGIVATATLKQQVQDVVIAAAVNARLDPAKLTFDEAALATIGSGTGNPVSVVVFYQYNPLFGSWVLPSAALQMRTSSVMRNE